MLAEVLGRLAEVLVLTPSPQAAHPNAFLSLSTGINMRQPHGTQPSSDGLQDPNAPPPIPKSLSTLILSAHPSRLLAESDWHNAGKSAHDRLRSGY